MTRTPSLQQVVGGLIDEGKLAGARADQATSLVADMETAPPWYVRAMVGFGAWLASLLLIGFVAGIGFATGGLAVAGAMLVAGAVLLRRQADNDFAVQSVLAASLAGQALFALGLVQALPGDTVKTGCVLILLMNVLLFAILPDRIHRVLSVLLATTALVVLLYALRANALVPLVGPLEAAALVMLVHYRDRLVAAGRGDLSRPLEHGLMLGACGCLLLSTLYLMPELGSFASYPRPWISTLLLAGPFVYLCAGMLRPLLRDAPVPAQLLAGTLALAVIAAAWAAPGLLLALIVLLLGAAAGDRFFVGAGIVFLVVFVVAWFHGIQVTMAVKSVSLVGTGAIILLARWLLPRVLAAPPGGVRHD